MNWNTILLLQAAPQQQEGSIWSTVIMMGAIFLIFWLFMIRPQQKKQKELAAQRDAIKKGDQVITSGGIYGRVKEVNEADFLIEIADGVRIRVDKNSVFPTAVETEKK